MITVQYYKYPRTAHWRHEMVHLGEDEHGVWLGAPVGSIVQKADEPARTWDSAFVQVVNPNRWWTAIFNHGRNIDIYVDVVTAPTWSTDRQVEMIDLDLDVIRRQDGTVYVDDEDEFEEHRVTLEYPPRMADTARATAARLVLDIESQRPPFDGTWQPWLDMVL